MYQTIWMIVYWKQETIPEHEIKYHPNIALIRKADNNISHNKNMTQKDDQKRGHIQATGYHH